VSEQGLCERCGEPIPPRTDPRGRKARYCSDACRAAAHRARREREHRAEVTQAREQLALRLPHEQAADAARLVREMTRDLRTGREFPVTPQHQELVAAINDFADLMDAHTAATQPPAASLSRQQRRAQQRKKRRK
jgi:hypothetical protein